MAKRGGSPHMKRLASPRYTPVARKGFVWLAKPMPGPHPANESVSILSLLRDILKVADNAREARRIIREGEILVDGRKVKRDRFPVGLMDIVSVPKMNKFYRVIVDSQARMKLAEIDEKEAKVKFCRVNKKETIEGKQTQIGLHDGRSMIYAENVHVGDTVKLAVPDQKIVGIMPLGEKAKCLVTSGRHAGKVATIQKMHPRRSRRDAEATLAAEDGEFSTVKKYLFVVGDAL